MEKLLVLLFMLSALVCQSKEVPSRVTAVIVFQTRAEVTREATVQLTAGTHELVFGGISTAIDVNSIRVNGKGRLTLLGISYRQNYLNQGALPDYLKRLKDRIAELEQTIQQSNNRSGALTTEANLLNNNQQFKGENANLSVAELRDMADYFRTRTLAISNEQLEVKATIDEAEKELQKVKAQLNERSQGYNQSAGEIVINVEAEQASSINIEISYLVSRVGWQATYDIRAQEVGAPLQLTYKAQVFQRTGENWNQVKLTLSTGDPTANMNKPDLNPQYLEIADPLVGYNKNGIQSKKMRSMNNVVYMESAADEEEVLADLEVNTVTQTFYTNYEIAEVYDLPSSNKPVNVAIRDQEIQATYEYQTVPKKRNRVFLVANIKDWGQLVLLPGTMNVFFEGGYVGETQMNPQTTEEELTLSLGYDPGITVKREPIQDLTSRKTIGSNITEAHAYVIEVRNNKKASIDLVVEDQVPVVRDSDIKLEVLETDGAELNENTGLLKWRSQLGPGEQLRKTIRYEVKYPKNKRLSGL